MKPSEFDSIIQKRGNKTVFWGFVLLIFVVALIAGVLVFMSMSDIPIWSMVTGQQS